MPSFFSRLVVLICLVGFPTLTQGQSGLNWNLDQNIWREASPFLSPSTDLFNKDNVIYREGRRFRYRYMIRKYNGQHQLMYVGPEAADYQSLTQIQGFDMQVMPGHRQGRSVVRYDHQMRLQTYEPAEYLTLIENERNLWLTLPRHVYFSILELCPFPYVDFPLYPQKVYSWSLPIDDVWKDWASKKWIGQTLSNMTYKVEGKIELSTPWGVRQIWIIQAQTSHAAGEAAATFWFDETLGFIKMSFQLPDGKSMWFWLEEVE